MPSLMEIRQGCVQSLAASVGPALVFSSSGIVAVARDDGRCVRLPKGAESNAGLGRTAALRRVRKGRRGRKPRAERDDVDCVATGTRRTQPGGRT